MIIVEGAGRLPNKVLLVGEAPGKDEARVGEPFVGKSGRELENYLGRHYLTSKTWYRTNVVKEYTEGNPDPTPEQIIEWTPVLKDEIARCRPQLVVAVGRFASRWFLGDDLTMDMVHGLPHQSDRAPGAVVLPVYHPAAGFYDNDIRAVIMQDFKAVAATLEDIEDGREIRYREDKFEGMEMYSDMTGHEIAELVEGESFIALDTEGTPSDPWSIQVSTREGTGAALRRDQPDFEVGIRALQEAADNGAIFIIHNAMYDIEMSREMGLELRDADIWDSMYAAYLMRLEPQALKSLIYRWCGMRHKSYTETVGDVGVDKQVEFLAEVSIGEWEPPQEQLIHENNGTSRLYTPRRIAVTADAILRDIANDKRNKDGDPVDPYKRWNDADPIQRFQVEAELGPMPVGTLADIKLEDAIHYACRDSDGTLRLYNILVDELEERDLSQLMADGMEVLPIFEEMQYNGMPASRSYFESLKDDMNEEMGKLQSQLSYHYFDKRPFNPASPVQVATLMRRRGITGAKRTKTGAVSTGKKSIEHHRYTDPAIRRVIEWREHQKIRDAYCNPVLNRIPENGSDLYPIRCNIKTTRVATRRLAASDPNLLGIPIRHNLGLRVRNGYRCPDGEVFGGWDLSQVEMRVMADFSGDPLLIERFQDPDTDVHAETAADIFHIPLPDVDPMLHRMPAKRAGFGIITSISGEGLYDQLRMFGAKGWNEKRCERLIKRYMEVYSGVANFMEECKERARTRGIVHDIWGMPRYLPGVWAEEAKVRAEAERTASSHIISGSAQGMIQNSMRWLKPRIREMQLAGMNVQWCLQIHDEVIFRFDEDLWEIMDELVTEALTEHSGLELAVPLETEGQMSKTWGGLK